MVVKILRPDEAAEFEAAGTFAGSPDDRRDGFIHLSRPEQVAGSLAKHFGGEDKLTLVPFDATALGDGLRWEVSRGGALFPHFYGVLQRNLALRMVVVSLDETGTHVIPEGAFRC
ncbi:MAG: DUF952 domain-containing protein [Hyphomicrobiaceae bacterium]